MKKKENNQILNLTYREAIKALNNIRSKNERIYKVIYNENIKIKFINDMRKQAITGETCDGLTGGKKYIKINVYNLKHGIQNGIVSDCDFVNAVVAIFHEHRHMENALKKYDGILYSRRNAKFNEKYLAVSRLSMTNNNVYYDENYRYMAYEIDAEYEAIKSAYITLKRDKSLSLSESDCEKLIVDYVNSHFQNGHRFSYFIELPEGKNKFDSFDEIKLAFEMALEMSKHEDRKINISCNDESMLLLKKDDFAEIKDTLMHNSPTQKNKGLKCDVMMSSLVVTKHKEFQNSFIPLKDINMSIENVFGLETPKDLSVITKPITHLSNQITEIDIDNEL